MKKRASSLLQVVILALSTVALVAGVAEARTSAAASTDCFYSPPFYVGACANDDECKLLCLPYWPDQNVGGCTSGPLCCICE